LWREGKGGGGREGILDFVEHNARGLVYPEEAHDGCQDGDAHHDLVVGDGEKENIVILDAFGRVVVWTLRLRLGLRLSGVVGGRRRGSGRCAHRRRLRAGLASHDHDVATKEPCTGSGRREERSGGQVSIVADRPVVRPMDRVREMRTRKMGGSYAQVKESQEEDCRITRSSLASGREEQEDTGRRRKGIFARGQSPCC